MRWPDWLIVILSGALLSGAVSILESLPLIEQRARSTGTYAIAVYSRPLPLSAIAFSLTAVVYLTLIRRAPRPLLYLGALSLMVMLTGAIMVAWSIFFLIRQGAPLGYDVYPDAFAHWYDGMAVGGALAVIGAAAYTLAGIVALIGRLRA